MKTLTKFLITGTIAGLATLVSGCASNQHKSNQYETPQYKVGSAVIDEDGTFRIREKNGWREYSSNCKKGGLDKDNSEETDILSQEDVLVNGLPKDHPCYNKVKKVRR